MHISWHSFFALLALILALLATFGVPGHKNFALLPAAIAALILALLFV